VRVVAVGTSDFVTVFKLCGVEAIEVSSPREMLDVIKRLVKQRDIGLILVEKRLCDEVSNDVTQLKLNYPVPVITEIPGIQEGGKLRKNYMDLLKQALGYGG